MSDDRLQAEDMPLVNALAGPILDRLAVALPALRDRQGSVRGWANDIAGHVVLALKERERGDGEIDTSKVVALARLAVMRSSGFISAWEFDPYGDVDGEGLHEQLRGALGISDEEYRSQQR